MGEYYLDGTLYYLGRDLPGVLAPVMLNSDAGKVLLLFSDEANATRHLARLPGDIHVHRVMAGDFRAKEELLRAALAEGAAQLWLDADPDTLEPARARLSAGALDYVLSFKNEVACI